MTALALVYALAIPILIGAPALSLLGLRWRDDRLGFAAWVWPVGCLGLAAVLQVAIALGVPGTAWWSLPLLLVAVLIALGRRRAAPATPAAPPPAGAGFVVFVLVGVAFCLWFAIAGMDRPCIEGDEGNIWSLKAKSLLVDLPDLFAAAQVYNLHPDYPQLNPLLQAWVYALTGVPEFVQFENRWPIQLCDIALFVAVAAALRHRLPAWIAAVLAAFVLLEPEFQSLCRTAYADGMVALGLVVALDGFLRWRDRGHRGHAWLAGLGLAFALWSKNETLLYVTCAAATAVAVRRWNAPMRGGWSRRNLLLLLPAGFVIAGTASWNSCFDLGSDLFGANATEHAGKTMFELMGEQWRERVLAMFAEAGRWILALDHIHVVFGLLLALVILVPRIALGRELAVPTLALLGAFVGLHAVYVGSPLPLRMHLDTSYLRVHFQLLPAGLVVIAAAWRAVAAGRSSGQTSGLP